MSEVRGDEPHPLARLITSVAQGQFLPVDGLWRRVPTWRPDLEAVLAFTGHAVLALHPSTPDELLTRLGADGLGGAHDPRLVATLAGPDGWIDSLDVLLARRGAGPTTDDVRLVPRPDLVDHPRVQFAAPIRDDLDVLGYQDPDRSALAILGRGVAGLRELSFELEPGRRGSRAGADLVRDALAVVPSHELVVAAVSPGNAASL